MTNHLGNFFREQRLQHGLSLGELARLVGYRNVSKGANRIVRFEGTGQVKEDLLFSLADVLGIDLAQIEELAEQDRQDRLWTWEAWVNELVPMHIVVRYMPAVYARKPLPEEINTHEEAEAFACEYARQHRFRVCLVLSRRHSVWFDALGQVYARTEATPDQPNMPFMKLKNSREFLLNSEE